MTATIIWSNSNGLIICTHAHTPGKAPFNGLLESIRSAQKTEFERVCAEKDAEVSACAYSLSILCVCVFVSVYISMCVYLRE